MQKLDALQILDALRKGGTGAGALAQITCLSDALGGRGKLSEYYELLAVGNAPETLVDVEAPEQPPTEMRKQLGGTSTAEREHPRKVPFSLNPSTTEKLQAQANSLGINLTEFLRRAAFAACKNPDILFDPAVEAQEQDYKSRLGASRWTFSTPTTSPSTPEA